MAEFLPCFEAMIIREGGYKLTNDTDDRGGMTYAGISRKNWPKWAGWSILDAGGKPQPDLVRGFYRTQFWVPNRLDELQDQETASSLFDFGVNTGPAVAAKLAQLVVGTTPDGSMGPKTLAAINNTDPELFAVKFALAKVARYVGIVKKDRSQIKYLVGWLNRTLEQA